MKKKGSFPPKIAQKDEFIKEKQALRGNGTKHVVVF